ncbi:MAG: hypothetical protein A3B47_04715 [Candidatus Levybacteria bacterium RIFCSPLOWO2_01_FULL_39_24]|nr:MAG: hypothetical protein A2800_04085 [Candidatus Levybacteria bacterium RIFCSPHIGHO2_01_FULL_40_16]OGH28023.1 MAG: hypothetical protein A3E12_01440 [Candidatus Levybacteria bacterium RIFCSPHIGHO2_12_FULL_39_9]OGH46747.1 MAG: hypothetical protein A3B47_04715 [Candidatus Levybacteria bacterium RIFCSPLOWO2_01_FULL_39_24]
MSRKIIGLVLGFCALILNLYSFYFHSIIDFTAPTNEAFIATLTWLISLILLGISIFILSPSRKTEGNGNNSLTLIEKFFLSIILIFGLILRIYKLNHLGLYLDEWYWLTNARGILDGIIRSPFGFIGDQPSNMPAYIVALFLAIFKNSYLAVRLPGVLYSLLNMILIFSFLKEAFNKRIALTAALLLSTSIWDIHMSQLGWNNVNLNPFLISGTLYFLYMGIKNLSPKCIFFCGIFLGISVNLLYVASLASIATVAYFTFHLVLNKHRRVIFYLFLLLSLTIFLMTSPTVIKINKYPRQSIARHRDFISQNIVNSKNQSVINYYFEQLKLGLTDFEYKQEKFNIVGLWGVTLEPFVFLFFLMGLTYTFLRIAMPQYFLIIANYIIMFIPIVILYRFTSAWREFGFLPTIYITASIGIYASHKLISRFIRFFTSRRQKMHENLIFVIIVAAYFASWYYFYSRYYDNHLKKEPDVYETYCKKIANDIAEKAPPKTLILLPDEICKNLIMISLWNLYSYKGYRDGLSLRHLIQENKHGLIVKILNGYTSSFDDKDLEYKGHKIFDKLVLQNNDIIYAYIYKF